MNPLERREVEERLPGLLQKLEGQEEITFSESLSINSELIDLLREKIEVLESFDLLDRGQPNLGKDYRLLEKLGRGGMGLVFLAEEVRTGRKVALKTIRPEIFEHPSTRERFRREAETVGKLRHEGIVSLIAFQDDGKQPFYVMEWVEGCTLAELLEGFQSMNPQNLAGPDMQKAICEIVFGKASSSLTNNPARTFQGGWEEACLRIIWQTAEALRTAHGQGVIHRDIKPDNLLLTPGGKGMLFDFGLASLKGESRLTGTGDQVGTLPYIPPEYVEGLQRETDEKGDIYSLGVTLYELLTLRLPFVSPSPWKTLQLILQGNPVPPRALNRSLNPDVEAICLKAMARDPRRRYQKVEDLCDDIAKVLDGGAVTKKREWIPTILDLHARHPSWFWLVVVGGAFLLGRYL